MIQDLQYRAQTIIIDAQSKWPKAISMSLWPHVVRLSCENETATISSKSGNSNSRIAQFENIEVRPKLGHFHPFGCPVYVLTNVQGSSTS
jgi:hypothetical protein